MEAFALACAPRAGLSRAFLGTSIKYSGARGQAQRAFLRKNFGDVPNWEDCESDAFKDEAPDCDLLLSGFPCQPFSIGGKGQGKRDAKGRGIVILSILHYIRKHLPGLVLLENVKGLVSRHGDVLKMIVEALEAAGYYVSWRLLDTHRYSGIPHKRQRFFLLALKTAGTWPARGGRDQFLFHVVWPRPIPCPALSSILDPVSVVADSDRNPWTQKYPRMNLANALRLVKTKAIRERRNPFDYCAVADLGGTKLLMGWNLAPCLTRSRGRAFEVWSLQHGRPLNLRELCNMQGLDVNEMNLEGTSCSALGAMLGNGFTCTMIARILASGLQALGLVKEEHVVAEDEDSGDGSLLGYDSHRGALGPDGSPFAGKAVSRPAWIGVSGLAWGGQSTTRGGRDPRPCHRRPRFGIG